jgi:hypothetical protein
MWMTYLEERAIPPAAGTLRSRMFIDFHIVNMGAMLKMGE